MRCLFNAIDALQQAGVDSNSKFWYTANSVAAFQCLTNDL